MEDIDFCIAITPLKAEGMRQVCYAVLSHRPGSDLSEALLGHPWILAVEGVEWEIYKVEVSLTANSSQTPRALFEALRDRLGWPEATQFVPDYPDYTFPEGSRPTKD